MNASLNVLNLQAGYDDLYWVSFRLAVELRRFAAISARQRTISTGASFFSDSHNAGEPIFGNPDFDIWKGQRKMATPRRNKAHSATVNRLTLRYGVTAGNGGNNGSSETDAEAVFDLVTDTIAITVETTATVQDAVRRLGEHPGPVYIAMTNREGVDEALALVDGTPIGIMDPKGEIVKPYHVAGSAD